MDAKTLEQLQDEILDLEARVNELTNERDTLSQNNESLSRDLENARTLNQKLFERVQAQDSHDADEDETPVQTCEEFAKSLTI